MTRLRTEIVGSIAGLPAPARDLWRREEARLQFDQTLDWSELLANHAREPGEETRIICAVEESGRYAGLLPLRIGAREGALGVRFARSLANYYSSLYEPILAADADPAAVLATLFGGLRQMAVPVDGVDLNPLPDGRPIASTLEQAGWSTETYFRFGNWYLEVAGRTYDAYFGGLSSQLRNTVKRKEKKLLAMPGASITIATTPETARHALADYERIYAASWKNPEPHPQFVPSLVRQLAARGWLRMGHVRIEGEPVAAQIWAVKDGIASIFKLAYDERFAQVSAGSVLTAHLMRYVLDQDRVHTVDYLTGDDAYKRDWMSHRRERVGVRGHRRASWRGQLALLASSARSALRPLLRRTRSK
jgi:CelD/BcsL family acetyltransferase involved in cellulose biosynthesis